MSGHQMNVRQDAEGRWYPHCSCRRIPHTRHLLRWQAEDILVAHKTTVDRALANLRRGRGTMKGEHDHAVKMAADPNVSDADREIWRLLAVGYASRLGNPLDEDALW